MERALRQQRAGRSEDAARTYGQVLARAAQTFDALHMLGVIELSRGNLEQAERLIATAAALRPASRAIERNREILKNAKLARESAHLEELCERALPLFSDLVLAPEPSPSPRNPVSPTVMNAATAAVHLIGRVGLGSADDAWLLGRITTLMKESEVVVWATDADPALPVSNSAPLRRLDPALGAYPRDGIHVFVGLNGVDNEWLARSRAARVIVFCLGASPSLYLDQLRAIACDGWRRIELVFPSAAMAAHFGRGHAVLPPPLERVSELSAMPVYGQWTMEEPAAWPVGVVGQNGRDVAEPHDAIPLRAFVARADRLDVYDPGRLRDALGDDRRVHFHPRRDGLLSFLTSVRCLLYRLPERWWLESSGRELFGAMALGLPVLCPRSSIYAEYIRSGIDGLLYDTYAQAQQYVTDLRTAPSWAAEIGAAARATASRLFDEAALERSYRELIVGSRR
ncbi:MAG TPA: glycosyltransferase [Casimicrobiaceae bacterium]|nr:glycosyltransferase [Casimicrobiaceae bacterium]